MKIQPETPLRLIGSVVLAVVFAVYLAASHGAPPAPGTASSENGQVSDKIHVTGGQPPCPGQFTGRRTSGPGITGYLYTKLSELTPGQL